MGKETRENTPEQPQSDPTEASKGFLRRWNNEIGLSVCVLGSGFWGFMAGMDLSSGDKTGALVKGIATAFSGVAAILNGVAMAKENRSLKDEVARLQGQDRTEEK